MIQVSVLNFLTIHSTRVVLGCVLATSAAYVQHVMLLLLLLMLQVAVAPAASEHVIGTVTQATAAQHVGHTQ